MSENLHWWYDNINGTYCIYGKNKEGIEFLCGDLILIKSPETDQKTAWVKAIVFNLELMTIDKP